MKDKLHIVSSDDCGKDEDGAQAFLRNHEALLMDIESYKGKVQDLRTQCDALCESNHYDSEKILSKQVSVKFTITKKMAAVPFTTILCEPTSKKSSIT